nr:hypothetical protein [Serratia ficaria]
MVHRLRRNAASQYEDEITYKNFAGLTLSTSGDATLFVLQLWGGAANGHENIGKCWLRLGVRIPPLRVCGMI